MTGRVGRTTERRDWLLSSAPDVRVHSSLAGTGGWKIWTPYTYETRESRVQTFWVPYVSAQSRWCWERKLFDAQTHTFTSVSITQPHPPTNIHGSFALPLVFCFFPSDCLRFKNQTVFIFFFSLITSENLSQTLKKKMLLVVCQPTTILKL